MNTHASIKHTNTARFLIGLLPSVCLALPLLAGPDDKPGSKGEAARVASKVGTAQATAQSDAEEREGLRHFQEDVAQYAALHSRQLAKLPKQEAVSTQKALAHAIVAKRADAKPGDIFRAQIHPLFRRLMAEQLQGPDALDARKSLAEGNPGDEGSTPVIVRVNAEYPVGAARSTVPPSVLLTLPQLPESLHYRFVGRDLLLVDSVAQIIVDVLPSAAPAIAAR